MLIDLTNPTPIFRPDVCKASLVVRVRVLEGQDSTAMWGFGRLRDNPVGRSLLTLEPKQRYPEGRDQWLQDFLLKAPRQGVYCFRVISNVPSPERQWVHRIHWIIIDVKPWPLTMVHLDTVNHEVSFEHRYFDPDSEQLPEAPDGLRTPSTPGETLWERLSKD